MEKLQKNTHFLEIERKYTANTVDWDDFVKKCKTFKPYRELLVRGPDTYYENGESIIRWRVSPEINELTTKSRFTTKSSLVREETDLKTPGNNLKTMMKFIDNLGYEKLFRIWKTCHIFWVENEIGKASIVIYKVESKDHPDRNFIEIEAEKGQPIKESKELIRYWEKELGLKKHWRINKTLLEIYSDRETQLLEGDYTYCNNCSQKKDIEEFYNRALGRTIDTCKECMAELSKSPYRRMTKKKYDLERRELKKKYDREYRQLNRDKIRERNKEYNAKKRINDIDFKLACNIRSRLYLAIRGMYKKGSAIKDMGCTVPELKRHIEIQFYENPETGEEMNWDNWGVGHGKWQIDHRKALSNFDLSKKEDFLEAVNFKNLQPIWYSDHVIKTKEDIYSETNLQESKDSGEAKAQGNS